MIAALILDFDGLLVDTETPALESWRRIFADYGCDLSMEVWRDVLGTSGRFDVFAHLVALTSQQQPGVALERTSIVGRRNALKTQLTANQPLLPGVVALLDQAAALGLACAVASSSSREWVEGWLRQHGIYARFQCVRTADDVTVTKPDPELFLSAAACLNIAPAHCLVFEDSPNGILAAQAAGMRCVAVPGAVSSQVDLPLADLLLPALDALPLEGILERIRSLPRQVGSDTNCG